MNRSIIYIGQSIRWYKDLQYQLRLMIGDNEFKTFNFDHIEKLSNTESLVFNQAKVVIVDYGFEQTTYAHVFNKIKEMFPKNQRFFIGINEKINEKEISKMTDHGINFIYPKTKNSEELKFISRNILNIIDNTLVKKANFAVAKTDQSSILTVREKITNLSFKKFSIETNYQLESSEKVTIKAPIFDKLNFINEDIDMILTSNTSNKKYKFKHEFDNHLLREDELDKIRKESDLLSQKKKVTKKEALREKMLEKINEKKHKYLHWKKQYQNFYVKNEKKDILLLSKKNDYIISKDNKITNEYNFINKIELLREDQEYLMRLNPSFVVIDFEETDFTINTENNKPQFKDFRFHQNSIKTISFLSELYQNKKEAPLFLIFNKTSVPNEIIEKALRGLFCTIDFVSGDFNENNISYFIREFDSNKKRKEINSNRNKDNLSLNTSSNAFFNKKDVLSKNQITEEPLYFDKIEDINSANISLEGNIELMSEYQLLISSKHELPQLVPIKLDFPYPIYFTILPNEELDKNNKANKFKRYKAIINAIDNKQRDQLRGFVINFSKQYKLVV